MIRCLYFIKRDIVLLAATILIVFAAWMYLEIVYAIAIGAAIFFGLKYITVNRKTALAKQVGEGLCAECGEKVDKGKCPNCDLKNDD